MKEGSGVQISAWSRALVALRSFMGIVYFTNGLAKLAGFSHFSIGPWSQYLINRDDARGILASNVHNAQFGIGVFRDFATSVVLPNWDVIGWVVTAGELAVGLGLLLGIFGRVAALGGFAMAFLLFIWALGSGVWTYDYLFEPVLLAILVFTPGLPGLDSLMSRRRKAAPAAPP
jgi:thiosulfate dehydrogenase [quinone] large subunit